MILPAKLTCSESPHNMRQEAGGGGVAKPDTLSTGDGSGWRHRAVLSESATKPCITHATCHMDQRAPPLVRMLATTLNYPPPHPPHPPYFLAHFNPTSSAPPPNTSPLNLQRTRHTQHTISAQRSCAAAWSRAGGLTLIASSSMPWHRMGGSCMASSLAFGTCRPPVMAGVEHVDSLQHPTLAASSPFATP